MKERRRKAHLPKLWIVLGLIKCITWLLWLRHYRFKSKVASSVNSLNYIVYWMFPYSSTTWPNISNVTDVTYAHFLVTRKGCMQVALSNHTKTDTKQTRVLNRGRDSYNFPSYICVTMSPTRHFFSLRIRWNRDNSEPLHKDSPVNVSRYGKTGEHGSWPE